MLSNPDTGLTLTNTLRQNVAAHGEETVNEDGTLTIRFDDRLTGMPERWLDHDGKTLIKDNGYVHFVGEVVIDLMDPDDPFDDVVLHVHEDIVVHGPHPILENGRDPAIACDLLS